MNILMISTFPPRRCGIGDYTADLTRELAKKGGLRVKVLTYEDGEGSGTSSQDGFEISRQLEKRTPPGRMASLLKQFEADLVHLQSSSFLHHPSLSAAVARTCAVPLVTTVHDTPGWWRVFYTISSLRKVYKKAARLITHSPAVSEALRDLHHVEERNIVELPHGVDTKSYNPEADGGEVRRRYNLDERRIVLFFGFLRPGKGLETLIRAWKRINHTYTDAVLVIAGGTPSEARRYAFLLRSEKDYPLQLRQLVRRLGLVNTVLFTGYVPEEMVPGLFGAAEIVVLPYGGNLSQSGPLHKAISCGRPVITACTPGIEGTQHDESSVVLVSSQDEEALAKSIASLLTDSALARKLSLRGRNLAKRCLSWSMVAQETSNLYREVCNAST